jgi:hypothetical protein
LKQVIYTETPVEFQRFYEVLLSKRLLRGRYHSIATERNVLVSLPPMEKVDLMIRDVELSLGQMQQFRKYLFGQLQQDSSDEKISSAAERLVLSKNGLQINTIAATVWPASHASPSAFSSLAVPPELKQIQVAYQQFFEEEDLKRQEQNKSAVVVSKTSSTSLSNQDQKKKRGKEGSSRDSSASAKLPVQTTSKGARTAARRLNWCHGAGTVVTAVKARNGVVVYLTLSEPQYVLLNAIDSLLQLRQPASIGKVIESTGMTWSELQLVLSSLLLARQSIVRISAPALLPFVNRTLVECRGCLLSIDNDFIDSLQSYRSVEKSFVFTTVVNLQDENASNTIEWRNEVIDACIVRHLKSAAQTPAAKTETPVSTGFSTLSAAENKPGMVPLDMLTSQVRTSLGNLQSISEQDIIRRTERLVSSGIIEKVRGNSMSFRSVYYSYVAAADAENSVSSDNNARQSQLAPNLSPKFSFGSDLFYDFTTYLLGETKDVKTTNSMDTYVDKYVQCLENTIVDLSKISPRDGSNAATSIPANDLLLFLATCGSIYSGAFKQLQSVKYQHKYGRTVLHDEWKLPAAPLLSEFDPDSVLPKLSSWSSEDCSRGKNDANLLMSLVSSLPDGVLLAIINRFERIGDLPFTAGLFDSDLHNNPFQYTPNRLVILEAFRSLLSETVTADLQNLKYLLGDFCSVPKEFQLICWTPYVPTNDVDLSVGTPIRSAPGGGELLGTLLCSTQVFITEIKGDWGRLAPWTRRESFADSKYFATEHKSDSAIGSDEAWIMLQSCALGSLKEFWQPWDSSRHCELFSLTPAVKKPVVSASNLLFDRSHQEKPAEGLNFAKPSPAVSSVPAPAFGGFVFSLPSSASQAASTSTATPVPVSASAPASTADAAPAVLYKATEKVTSVGHRVRRNAAVGSDQVRQWFHLFRFVHYA